MTIVPKSAEVLLEEFQGLPFDNVDGINEECKEWLKSALASHLAWAAGKEKPPYDYPDFNHYEGGSVNGYYNALLALSEKLVD